MEDVYDERVNIKLNFYGELIDYAINSDYLSFLKDLCGIFGLSMNQLNSISLSYNDEDGDVIMVSTKEDFAIFLEQAKQKVVDTLIVEVKEESNIDPISLMDSALNYQEQVEEANANLINSNQNNINNDNNINNNNNYYNINNNYYNYDYNNIQNQEVNNEAPLVFYVECNKCQIYPLLERIYYCQQCDMCLCDECKIKNENHEHPLLKIETEDDFEIIKKAYEDKVKLVENNNNEQINNINYQNSQNYVNQNYNNQNNSNPNYNNQNNSNYNNNYPPPNYQYIPPSNYINRNISHSLFPGKRINPPQGIRLMLRPIEKLTRKAIEKRRKRRKFENNYKYQNEIKKMVEEARKNYDLDGINDQQIINALYQTNGNIEQAIVLLTQ